LLKLLPNKVLPRQFELPGGLLLAGWQSKEQAIPDALCLHGWLDNANSFLPLAAELPELSLLSIDLPGHGHSSHRSSDAFYHFLDYVHDIATFLSQQNWGAITLIGHSMGGMIATVVAAVHPELVKQLILIDSIGLISGQPEQIVQQLRSASLSRWQSHRKRKPIYPDLNAAAAARLQQGDLDFHSALLLAQRGTEHVAEGVTWRADLRLRESSMYRLLPEQITLLLQSVLCPVYALLANDGLDMMQHACQQYRDHYRQLQLMELSGGHHCHMTAAPQTAQIIRQVLLAR